MANRTPRKPIEGLFPNTSIQVVDHPELPGLNFYRLRLGVVDTHAVQVFRSRASVRTTSATEWERGAPPARPLTPAEEARAEFSRLRTYIDAEQEKQDRQWLQGKVKLLCFPYDPEQRRRVLARANEWLKGFEKIEAPTNYDLTIQKIYETAASYLRKPDARLSHSMIRNKLVAIYGPAFADRFSVDQVRRALTQARKTLRTLTPHTAQL